MIKTIYTHDNDALLQRAAGQMVTLFLNSRHIKSAASNAFSDKFLRSHLPDDDHFGMHAIAMGASEQYGFNKNGDHWSEDDLRRRHHTFVSHGNYYEEHRNRDPKLKIGDIKAAAYNEEMDRVELIIHGHKKKAEKQFERAKAGKALSGSMSARVPFDVCSCCEHHAKSSRVYCEHLRNRMTQFVPEFQKFAYARNPDPTFFDYSDVQNPADRIAWYLQYMLPEEGLKAASAGEFPFSDVIAERLGVALPETVEKGWSTSDGRKWLEKLAMEEAYVEAVQRGGTPGDAQRAAFVKHAMPFMSDAQSVTEDELSRMRTVQPDVLFHLLGKQAGVLPFPVFYALLTNQSLQQTETDAAFKVACEKLPTIFRDLQSASADAELEAMLTPASLFKVACTCGPGDPVQELMNQVSDKISMQPAKVSIRVMRICAAGPEAKCAAEIPPAAPEVVEKAASYCRAYATYKVAQFVHLASQGNNLVDDPTVPLLFCHHKS